jgi:hypothetical protein
MTPLHDDSTGPWYRLDIDAEHIESLDTDLREAMRKCQDPSQGSSNLRNAAQVRFWIVAAITICAWFFGVPQGLLIVLGIIGVGYSLLQALNDWATHLYVLALYHSDQALYLHGHQLYVRPLGESRKMGWK